MQVFKQWQAIYDEWERETTDRGRQEGRRQGVTEGVKKGETRGLLRLLERRFGTVPETVTARVARASIEDIERWFDRAVDAATLDDVFAR